MAHGTSSNPLAKPGQYKMKVEKGITVTMRDGVKISLCVYRPDAPGQFPALFAASPYQWEMDEVPAYPLFLWRETGPIEWYVSHGYAYVHADVRGSGQSEGEFRFMDRTEQEDYVELIAWIVKQAWCTGKVGGIGQSYYAVAQWAMACDNPPGLACIIPYDGLVDQYRGSNYHGGIYCSYRPTWYLGLRANNQHRPAGGKGREPMRWDLAGAIIEHTLDDEFWHERSPYWRLKNTKVPVLSIGHWGKMGLHLRGNIVGYEEVTSPKKLIVTGSKNTAEAHHLFDQIDFHAEACLPFYDYWLKGIDNGVMDGPPVKIYVRGANTWREEEEWPLKRAQYVPYYLSGAKSGSLTSLNDGSLTPDAPKAGDDKTSYSYPDWEWANGVVAMDPQGRPDPIRRVLTFTTAPLEADLEVTGPIVLKLFASSTAIDTQFVIKVADQLPQDAAAREKGEQPRSIPVSKGWLKASHREKDETRWTDIRPFYTHTNPQPIEPGKTYEFDIEVLPTSYVFKKGHRIRLEIANSDSSITDQIFSHPYHPTQIGEDTLHHDAKNASRILLPVIKG